MVQSGNRFNNSNIIIAGEMCSLGCLSLSLLRLFRLCIRCVLFIGLDVTGTHIVICTHFYQPKRLIPEHLTHGFSAVLCELSGCVGGIKPACIQYYRHCNQPNEWCDVSLCFWCWLWILVRCNICNHIEKSFEELCISRLYQCTNATSIQVQNRNLIHQKKRVRNGSLVLHPIGDTENYPWPFKKKEKRVQWNEWMCDDVTQMRKKVVRYCKVF